MPAPDPSGIEAVNFIKRNLRECRHHKDCWDLLEEEFDPAFLPTRILKIKDGSQGRQIVLLDTSQTAYRYIALSHCWGSAEAANQMPRTTSRNISQHREGIAVSSLTRTFQDAVDLTVKLGLQYIWIDSLCIIQDDEEDWMKECPRMMYVYGLAYLVVAATAAENGGKGLYIARKSPKRVTFRTPTGRRVKAVVESREFTFPAHHVWKVGEDYWEATNLPLLKRAWAFQERLFAPRIIHFTPAEIVWECMSSVGCECGNLQDTTAARSAFGPAQSFKSKFHDIVIRGCAEQRLRYWHCITAQYSARELTRSSDRLPALACVARLINPRAFGRYLYGIWEDTLPVSLLWWSETADDDHPAADSATTHFRPRGKSIPTWSWMSVEGRVSTWGRRGKVVVEVTKVPTTLTSCDRYGKYTDPSIILKGHISEVAIQTSPDRLSQSVMGLGSQITNKLDADTHPFEYSDEELRNSRFIAVQICSMPGLRKDGLFLVLRETEENDETYERVGIAFASSTALGPSQIREVRID